MPRSYLVDASGILPDLFAEGWTGGQLSVKLVPEVGRPGGSEGDGRAGVLTWRRCALLCGPVMRAMTVGHSPVLMVNESLAAWW